MDSETLKLFKLSTVNNLHNFSSLFRFVHFADDTRSYLFHRNLQTSFTLENQQLEKVSQGKIANWLLITIKKTQYTSLTIKMYNEIFNFSIQNKVILLTNATKFLGIFCVERMFFFPTFECH